MDAFEDPTHPGNGPKYHTGRVCITPDCDKPAGTMWGPPWCFEHNVERIRRITRQMETMLRDWPKPKATEGTECTDAKTHATA